MAVLELDFDRGTLRLGGDAADALDDPRAPFDARTGFRRAAAYRYAEILGRARHEGLRIEDRVAAAVLRRPRAVAVASLTLRAYQQQAVAAFERFGGRGVVALPTGSGKTRVACAAIARAAAGALVLVPTCALLEQWTKILEATFGGPIGVVGDGASRVEPVTVMTFESAFRKLDVHGHRFGLVVVDEAHHFGSGARAEALEMCTAPRRLGLTATPPEPGSRGSERLRELIGPVVFEIEVEALAGRDLAPFEIVRIHLSLSSAERARYDRDIERFTELRRELLRMDPSADYLAIVRAIARTLGGADVLAEMQRAARLAALPDAKRSAIRELVARHGGEPTLIFTATTEDAYAVGEQELVPVITAETSKAERAEILGAFRARSVRALASARVLNEGVDVPEASVAIIAAGALGAREHVQRIGRVLRPQPGKRALVYELVTIDTVDEARARARSRRVAAR
jgi:superfamily II DNA or RNA helicase